MNIRLGFVSNSSSSSFILACRKQRDRCEFCGRESMNITELVSSFSERYTELNYEDTHIEKLYTKKSYLLRNKTVKRTIDKSSEYFDEESANFFLEQIDNFNEKDWYFMEVIINRNDMFVEKIINEEKRLGNVYTLLTEAR